MAAPTKPWERRACPGYSQRQASFPTDRVNSYTSPQNIGGGASIGNNSGPNIVPRPPLPPRPTNYGTTNTVSRPYYGGYNSYSNGGYGMSPYGGYSGMGNYGYGGYNRYGMMGPPNENGFIQVAEESSRQAFQSIESIVHAFGSVSMMLESTYNAVYSSFRAVLGVAEHFSRMKSHFAQIFSALAVVRTLRWILRKLLYLIGLRSQDPNLEAAWRTTGGASSSPLSEADLKASRSSWPIVMFLGVVFGGPYLIWRLLNKLVPNTVGQKTHGWKKGVSEHFAAVAQYSFEAQSNKDLSLQAGQKLFLAPKDQQPQVRGWLLASNGTHIGLVPANYIKILGFRQGSPQPVDPTLYSKSMIENTGNSKVAPKIPGIPVVTQLGQTSMQDTPIQTLPSESNISFSDDFKQEFKRQYLEQEKSVQEPLQESRQETPPSIRLLPENSVSQDDVELAKPELNFYDSIEGEQDAGITVSDSSENLK